MKLRTINDLVIRKIPSLDPNNDSARATTTEYVNLAIDGVWRAANWEFRKKNAQLMLEPSDTTGTCSWTKLGQTVTFVGSSIAENWLGRYWTPKNSSSQYKIIYIDVVGASVTLATPIIDNSTSGSEFTVWKRFYSLQSNVDTLIDIRRWDGGGSLVYKPDSKLSGISTNLETEGSPYFFSIQGIDEYDDVEYSTGSVEGTENSDTLTGSGTSFLSNCGIGDIITLNTEEYTIKRVLSDTSLKLYQHLTSSIPSGTTFEIKKNNPLNITFYNPPDSYRICDYSFLSKAPVLKNEDYDFLKLDRDYIDAIIMRAQTYWLDEKDYQKYQTILAIYEAKVGGLKLKRRAVNPKFRQFEPTIGSTMPGRE